VPLVRRLSPPMVRNFEAQDRTFPEVFFPSQQQSERLTASLLLQVDFLCNTWAPMCEKIGMTSDQAMAVWGKWCLAIGSIFKETKVEERVFLETMQMFADNMVVHLQALKHYMHVPDWNDVVARIEAASDSEYEFLMKSGASHLVTSESGRPPDDPTDEVCMSFLHVYLPNVESPGEARIRVPFACTGVEKVSSPIQVTNNVLHTMRDELQKALERLPH
jgi:hypothetical protein